MIPATFDYVRAGSIDDAISKLSSTEDAKLLAGGHSLLPAMKLRVASPSMLIDITAGKPIEVEAIQGAVVRRGAAHGVPTPIMSTLYAVLQPHAGGRPSTPA